MSWKNSLRLIFASETITKSIRLSIIMIFTQQISQFSRFGSFETAKSYMVNEKGNLTTSGKLLAGLIAGCMEAVFAVTPMETIKVKFINDQRSANPKYKGFVHGVGMIVRQHGESTRKPKFFFLYVAFRCRSEGRLRRFGPDDSETRLESSDTLLLHGNVQGNLPRQRSEQTDSDFGGGIVWNGGRGGVCLREHSGWCGEDPHAGVGGVEV